MASGIQVRGCDRRAPSDKQTIGLLGRRHLRIRALKYVGKESNHLEEVESGLMHAVESVYTEYGDPRHDEWLAIAEALKDVSLNQFEQLTGRSRRMLIDARKGRRRPHAPPPGSGARPATAAPSRSRHSAVR